MFANIGETSNLNVTRIFESWLNPLDLDEIEQILKKDPSIKALTVVHSDTSTAVLNPIKEIGGIVRRNNRLLIVDCISSLGAIPFEFDNWGVDVAVTASQKGLMAPAGISFVALNDRAWKAVAVAEKSSFYIDFKKIKDFYSEKKETPGSTPVSIVASVNESLNLIFQEGLETRYQRHKDISSAIKGALESLGLDLFPKGNFIRSDSLSAFYAPNAILPEKIKKIAREKYNIAIASGLGRYKNETFRVGHLGMVNIQQALTLISALEFIFKELGVIDRIGQGLTQFYKYINAE
jgi:aspartate aminotransferase-like enzyme